MRIFGEPSDGVLDRKDFIFLGLLITPFDLPFVSRIYAGAGGVPETPAKLTVTPSVATELTITASVATELTMANMTTTDLTITAKIEGG